MRQQNENVTSKNLTDHLKAIHPANILGGIWTIRDFALNTFHGGSDPNNKAKEHPIFREASELWSFYSRSASDFELLAADYSKLLTMFAAYLSAEGMSEAHAQITRIQSALALEGAQAQRLPVPVSRWKNALACLVALSGAGLLEYTCKGEAWEHFVVLLALLMVAVPVWKLAASYGQRKALAPITQPTR